jgi:hypothetical protein
VIEFGVQIPLYDFYQKVLGNMQECECFTLGRASCLARVAVGLAFAARARFPALPMIRRAELPLLLALLCPPNWFIKY